MRRRGSDGILLLSGQQRALPWPMVSATADKRWCVVVKAAIKWSRAGVRSAAASYQHEPHDVWGRDQAQATTRLRPPCATAMAVLDTMQTALSRSVNALELGSADYV